jgi:hypothetical protein
MIKVLELLSQLIKVLLFSLLGEVITERRNIGIGLQNVVTHITMADKQIQFCFIFIPIEGISILVISFQSQSDELHRCFLNGQRRVFQHVLA